MQSSILTPQESLDCFVATLLAMTGESGGHSMIDHISVGVSDLERSARFYEATLAPLGLSRLVTRPATIGFGKTYPEFWINLRAGMAQVAPESGTHICLRAKSNRRCRCVPRRGAEGRRPLRRRAGPAPA